MSQRSITFDAPHNHTTTSIAAAARISATGRSASWRMLVLATLRDHPWGLTCDEVEVVTGLKHQTASARIRDLSNAGLIYHHGTRATRSGYPARVYLVKNP